MSLLLDGLVLKARVPIHGVSANQVCQNMPMISNAVPKSGVARPLSYTHSHTLHACVVHMYPASLYGLFCRVWWWGGEKGGVQALPLSSETEPGIWDIQCRQPRICSLPARVVADKCQAPCAPSTQCLEAEICDLVTGVCQDPVPKTGQACDDGDSTTKGGIGDHTSRHQDCYRAGSQIRLLGQLLTCSL